MNAFKCFLFTFLLTPLVLFGQIQNNTEVIVQVSKEKININGVSYYLHTVKKGENLYRIGLAYGVSQRDIIMANSEIDSDHIKEGSILKIPVLPTDAKYVSLKDDGKYFHYIVEEGQTITYLCQKFNISKEELFKYNPDLEVAPMQLGQVVNLPKNRAFVQEIKTVPVTQQTTDYKVKRKETKFSIAKQFNISIDDLVKANPVLNSTELKAGQVIQVPVKNQNTEQVEQSEIMVPKDINNQPLIVPFSERLKVALLIPFFLEENDAISALDTLQASDNDHHLESFEVYQRTQNFIEFYQGVLLAIDSLKKCGLKIDLYTYDAGRDTMKIKSILKRPEIKSMNLIIGPFYSDPAEYVAHFCLNHQIKMISPVLSNVSLLKNNPYVIEIVPNDQSCCNKALSYIESLSNRHVIFIQSDRPLDSHINELYKNTLDEMHISYKLFHYNDNSNQLIPLLNSNKQNIIIIPTEDEGLVSTILPVLNKETSRDTINVFGLPVWVKFKNIDLEYFYNLHFHYTSTFYIDYSNNSLLQQFLIKYKYYNFTEPYFHSREGFSYLFTKEGLNYAYLGYDVAYYFLNSMGRNGINSDNWLGKNNIQLLHTNLHFEKLDAQSGYFNEGINIIHYNDDFTVNKVK